MPSSSSPFPFSMSHFPTPDFFPFPQIDSILGPCQACTLKAAAALKNALKAAFPSPSHGTRLYYLPSQRPSHPCTESQSHSYLVLSPEAPTPTHVHSTTPTMRPLALRPLLRCRRPAIYLSLIHI